jgi:lysophospholipase L1-like esterase
MVLAGCGSLEATDTGVDEGDSDALWFSKLPGYVAVGDSIDFGIGASTPDAAYTSQFHTWLETEYFGGAVDFENLAVPGATSADILSGQVLDAIIFNAQHLFKEKVITVGSGGNDLLGFIQSAQFAPCATGNQAQCQANLGVVLNKYATNLEKTMAGLRILADQHSATLVARTQYNGFLQPSCSVNGAIDANGNVFLPPALVRSLIPLGFLALEGAVQDPTVTADPFPGLNDIMRAKAKKYKAVVADIALPFVAGFQGGQTLLIRDCIHPNDAGHDLITNVAVQAFSNH